MHADDRFYTQHKNWNTNSCVAKNIYCLRAAVKVSALYLSLRDKERLRDRESLTTKIIFLITVTHIALGYKENIM